MIKVLKLATWENAEAGECFVERGKPLDRLMVIYSGKACAEVDGRNVTELQPGHFIGSISYVTEETSPANVVARSEEHTSELQSLILIYYAVFSLKKKIQYQQTT